MYISWTQTNQHERLTAPFHAAAVAVYPINRTQPLPTENVHNQLRKKSFSTRNPTVKKTKPKWPIHEK